MLGQELEFPSVFESLIYTKPSSVSDSWKSSNAVQQLPASVTGLIEQSLYFQLGESHDNVKAIFLTDHLNHFEITFSKISTVPISRRVLPTTLEIALLS